MIWREKVATKLNLKDKKRCLFWFSSSLNSARKSLKSNLKDGTQKSVGDIYLRNNFFALLTSLIVSFFFHFKINRSIFSRKTEILICAKIISESLSRYLCKHFPWFLVDELLYDSRISYLVPSEEKQEQAWWQ